MKLQIVHLYQAVAFKNSTQKFFNISGIDKARDEEMHIKLLDSGNIVQIEQGNDLVLIPTTNVAIMVPIRANAPQENKKEVPARKKLGFFSEKED